MLMIVAALAALSQASAPANTPTDRQFEQARRALNASLIDYPDARFRDVRADSRRICGYVNGRNRIGAFSGWQRFVVMNVPDAEVRYEQTDRLGMIPVICDDRDDPLPETNYSARLTQR